MLKKILFCFLLFISFTQTHAKCIILDSAEMPAPVQHDSLYLLLSKMPECPHNYAQFQQALKTLGTSTFPTMVANRGFHNPTQGSFSFFEMVLSDTAKPQISALPGEFFIGHFSTAVDKQLVLDQRTHKNNLMMELIVWDPQKNYYNFYELRGTGYGSQWFYRGDSLDALSDNTYLYRANPQGTAKFGNRMRCSACHNSGGPIMKEIKEPHNDWWRKNRFLPLGFNQPSADVMDKTKALIDASALSKAVITGINKLERSGSYQQFKNTLSLQEQLRPLFCDTEINLESSPKSLIDSEQIEIPSAFFVSPFLVEDTFAIPKANYQSLISQFRMKFPETNLADADHPWLTPVKGYSDLLAIQTLIDSKVIDKKFAGAVLAVDLSNPLFSAARCSLLGLIPEKNDREWQVNFLNALKNSSLPQAKLLYTQLVNPATNFEQYQQQAQNYVAQVKRDLYNSAKQREYFQKLIDLRRNMAASEISQNPRGQILEPGFRVIFPESISTHRASPPPWGEGKPCA